VPDTLLTSPDSPCALRVDSTSGLPTRLLLTDADGEISRDISCGLSATVGGSEHRHPTGGLRYEDTEELGQLVASGIIRQIHRGSSLEFVQDATLGPLVLQLRYRIFPVSPYVEFWATIGSDSTVVIRNMSLTMATPRTTGQVLNAPGNMLRRNVPVAELGDIPAGLSPIGGLRGATGVLFIHDGPDTLSFWPNNPSEIPDLSVAANSDEVSLSATLNFAAEVSPGHSAEVHLTTLSLEPGDFAAMKERWPSWATRYGLTSPADPPEWMHGSGIYEVQIGTSYFWKDHAYCQYEEIRDLIADLDRVYALGFRVIQLMPRQPYPSYNVHDYADVTTSYGDADELRALVADCHSRGMRVILDVLLHGVLDNESIDSAIEGVKNGPLMEKLDNEVSDTLATDLTDDENYSIAWSRHILDFGPYWKAGSPQRTPLEESHPEWFATDSSGRVAGVYTKAFDARSPGWQRYFRDSMMHLVREYDVDGFRFDAPTYNFFANWAPWARARAFMSPVGCVPLFIDMRHDIKSEKPDALMYTEPSGHLLRQSMDVNYNYDEQWLVSALMTGAHTARGVRHARDFMQWMEDRDSFLPQGSHTAHHIDSHDTFWWPQWGKKWRREQYPLPAVEALVALFLSLDGPYMMFTGGEEGLDTTLEALLNIRNTHRHLWAESAVFDTSDEHSPDLFIASRAVGNERVVSLVNLSGSASAAIPAQYRGLSVIASARNTDTELEPYGYVWLDA